MNLQIKSPRITRATITIKRKNSITRFKQRNRHHHHHQRQKQEKKIALKNIPTLTRHSNGKKICVNADMKKFVCATSIERIRQDTKKAKLIRKVEKKKAKRTFFD